VEATAQACVRRAADRINENEKERPMSLGGVILLALVIAVVVIGVKVKNHSQKLHELDELLGHEIEEHDHRRR
jgi:hypothetical protein